MVQRTIAHRNNWIHKNLSDSEHYQRYVSVRRRLTYSTGKAEVGEMNRGAVLKELQALTNEKERLERQLADEIGVHRDSILESTASQIMNSLSQNTAVIDILELSDPSNKGDTKQYTGFIVTASTIARVDFGDSSAIDQACRSWLVALNRPNDFVGERSAATMLSALVWKRIAVELPDNCNRLYFCPDGILAQIPWIALFTDEHDFRVLNRYTVSLLPYGQLLVGSAADFDASWKSVLLVGDVDYGSSKWSQLPGTVDELAVLSSTIGSISNCKVTTLRKKEATEDSVFESLPSANVAHFATHGQFVGDDSIPLSKKSADRNPLLSSSLILAPSDQNAQKESIVTGEQIAGLDLRMLRLVTLSACDTGRGQVLDGDGVYGLQQAFHIAGANSVVASRWRIDDKQTVAFMNTFYEQMIRNKTRSAEAMAAAQKLMRTGSLKASTTNRGVSDVDEEPMPKPGQTKEVHPFYWASFQHSGR